MWRHRWWWGVNTYGVIGGGGASIHMASSGVVGSIHMASSGVNTYGVNTYGVIVGGGAWGVEYIWRHRGWWGVNTCGVIGGGGASIHMAS